ncbi:MAG TPA: 16S rRNA (cytosine(1402)-N(4))-methyltransferase RsmH [Stellaceae bacterium]|nr:16S rRNA (cytosine(1402)-N(4))-methyltransferase RsmH [Stellaceae bacterium]
MNETQRHIPVLLDDVVLALAPRAGQTVLDGTFGRGGYTRALLEAAPCRVVGIDRDPTAIAAGRTLAPQFGGRLTLVEGRFGDMIDLLASAGISRIDGVTLDLGVSSPQLDDAARGFSFRFDGPLDMRMGSEGPDAASVVNTLPETELANIIWRYGEERMSRRVAGAIVAARREALIERTSELAQIVRRVVPASRDGIDPATRTFQALRIYVNDELGELDRGLAAAEKLLPEGGRLAIVSFHSLEDRVVKTFLRERSDAAPQGSRHQPGSSANRREPSFRLIARKPVVPSAAEAARNPRARSAKLRVAERTSAPAWGPASSVHAAFVQ